MAGVLSTNCIRLMESKYIVIVYMPCLVILWRSVRPIYSYMTD